MLRGRADEEGTGSEHWNYCGLTHNREEAINVGNVAGIGGEPRGFLHVTNEDVIFSKWHLAREKH